MTTLNIPALKPRDSAAVKPWLGAGAIATLAWIAIWLGINSGPEVLATMPTDALGWAHFLRTLAPLLVLFIFLPTVLSHRFGDEFPGAAKFWVIYGIIGAAMSVLSAEPLQAAYWAGCYLSAFLGVAIYLQSPDPLRRAVQLNYLSWIIAAIFLAILMYLARGILFTGEGLDVTAYYAQSRMPVVADMAMSRSSGMARFAA
ncbi:MAG TPA: hypothetical protein VGF52_04185, partial [Tepidisphaeraceae bacterium]